MWTREYLKTRAKAVLKVSYWKAFLVSLVIAFAGGNNQGGGFSWNFGGGNYQSEYGTTSSGEILAFLAIALIVSAIVILFVAAFRIFLGYPLEVGGRRFYIQAAQNTADLNYLGYAFKKERYMDIIKAMLYKGVFNFLWYLLLIIPGIVKSYAYSMVPYLLTDNPHIGYKRALELSKEMTNGQKWNMFVLDLSFLGWYLLGLLACCIGVIFVTPYVDATRAELYLVLRQNAIDNGLLSYEELMLDLPSQQDTTEY